MDAKELCLQVLDIMNKNSESWLRIVRIFFAKGNAVDLAMDLRELAEKYEDQARALKEIAKDLLQSLPH